MTGQAPAPLGLVAPCAFCGVSAGRYCLPGCPATEPPPALPADAQRILERLQAERCQTMARWKLTPAPAKAQKPATPKGDLRRLAAEMFPNTGRRGAP